MNSTMNGNTAGNPSTHEGVHGRYTGLIGGGWKTYGAGARIGADQSAPTTIHQMVALGKESKAEIMTRCPTGVTGYTVHVGRWVDAPEWTASAAGVTGVAPRGWVEVDQMVVGGVVADQLSTMEVETRGAPIGVYIDGIVGTVDAADSMMVWVRGFSA